MEGGHTALFGWKTGLVIILQRGKAQGLSSWYYASWEDHCGTPVNLKNWFFEAHPRKYIHGYFQGEPISPKSQIQFLSFVFWVHIIRGKGLTRTDGIQAPPSVNYTHSCYHLTLQRVQNLEKQEAEYGLCQPFSHQIHNSLSDSAGWVHSWGNCTNWNQAREKPPSLTPLPWVQWPRTELPPT